MRRIIKRILVNEGGARRIRLAVAFVAGMAVAAGLAHVPVAANMFSPRPIEGPVVPIAPSVPGWFEPGVNPDTDKPGKTQKFEMVSTTFKASTFVS